MAFKNRSQIEDKISDQDLDLSCEGIVDIPVKEIAYFHRVSTIDLSNNHIRLLTTDFPSMLRQLVHLDLSKNLIQKLPENFGSLVNLRHLDLYKNQLERLPLSISNLKKLRWLDLKDNPLVPTLRKVAGDCFNADQCQQCAKSIVGFMNQIEQKVGEQDSTGNLDSQLQQQSFNSNSKGRSGGVQNKDMMNGRPARSSTKSMSSQPVQEFSSDDEQENLSESRDEVVTTKKKRKRNSNKKTSLPAPVADDVDVDDVDEYESSTGLFKECIIWLSRSTIWLLMFLGVFFLLCSLCLSSSGLKNVISVISSNEQLNQYLLRRHEWIQSDLLNRAAFSTVRDYGKDYFAIFVNYFNTLVESVVHSLGVIINPSGK